MRILITIIFAFLIISCSGDKNSTKIKSYKIINSKSNFSLPERFEIISGNDLFELLETEINPPSNLVKDKMNTKQVHFVDYNSDDLVSIIPFAEKLPIERLFLNAFVEIIEEGSFKKAAIDYELVEKRFITSKKINNNALKTKFKYSTKIGDKYTSMYLLTTKKESLMVIVHSFDDYDMQNMVIKYLNEN